ncbi:hypothetical protein HU200_040931 [Digitaria exilis]|uniref:CMP/dCMP-type deaminase domain-containing protein n=1 Tax=Digitaria exilis TaxID=1010633 RepID=A0A835BD81_9POAL|nr:hypothetical protein HU200_040931 [Digitaria exilis]
MEVPAPHEAGQEERDHKFITKAVDEAYRAVDGGGGGPFGAVIVRGDEEVVSCHNQKRYLKMIFVVELQKVVYGAKAEVAAAAGFNASIPDAFVEYYKKSGIEVRQAEGDTVRIAEEVFDKAKEKFRIK